MNENTSARGYDPTKTNPDLVKFQALHAMREEIPILSIHSDAEIIAWSALKSAHNIIAHPIGIKKDSKWFARYEPYDKIETLNGDEYGIINPHGLKNTIAMIEHVNKIRPSLEGRARDDYKQAYTGTVIGPPAYPMSPFYLPQNDQKKPGIIDRLLNRNKGPSQ